MFFLKTLFPCVPHMDVKCLLHLQAQNDFIILFLSNNNNSNNHSNSSLRNWAHWLSQHAFIHAVWSDSHNCEIKVGLSLQCTIKGMGSWDNKGLGQVIRTSNKRCNRCGIWRKGFRLLSLMIPFFTLNIALPIKTFVQ